MVDFKVRPILRSLIVSLLLVRFGWGEEVKTNEIFLREAVNQLLSRTISQAIPQMGDTLYLREEGKHPASWLLQEELLLHLTQNKREVFLFDSSEFSHSNPSFLPNAEVLSYRLIELGVSYSRVERKGFLSKKIITREGKASAFFYLVNATNGEILWQIKEENVKFDKIDLSYLKKIENRTFPFLWAELPPSATKKYVEPALVTAVVGGLVYLFFANR